MKRILFTLFLGMGISLLPYAQTTLVGQTNQTARKKIAVYVSSILSEDLNKELENLMAEGFQKSAEYTPYSRSKDVHDIMKKAQAIQQSGYIDINQTVNFTKQFGEEQLCAISVSRINNPIIINNSTFVFRATIVDFATGEIIKSTSCSYDSKIEGNEIPYAEIQKASQKLIDGLCILPPKPIVADQKPQKKKNSGHTDLAWGIAGVGYPWSLVTSFNFRYGDIVGFGLYADFGLAFTHINAESTYFSSYAENYVTDYYWTTKAEFHYAAGAKFYMYKGLNIGCGYGSIHTPKTDIAYNFGSKGPKHNSTYALTGDDAKIIRKQFNENNHGVLIHAGYDVLYPDDSHVAFFMGFNAGISLDLKNGNKIAPYVNLKLGISFNSDYF